jgi:phosphocarrier protein HPr
MRPVAMFVRLASRFHSNVWVAKDGIEVDGKSVMSLIALSARRGAELRIRVEGTDAAEARCEIEQLIRSDFEEE